jgi:hypothetical protein
MNILGLPDVVTLADDTRALPVDGCLDQGWHLDTLVVSNAPFDELKVVQTVDCRREDDERSDISSRIGFQDEEVDVSMQGAIGQRVDREKRWLCFGVGAQVRVDLQGFVVSGCVLLGVPMS